MTALPPLSELYRKHRRRAVSVAQRILGDPDEAEDVVQDVFIRLHCGTARFDGAAAYTTWLHRVLVNSSINRLRARRRSAKLASSLPEPEGPEDAAAWREEHRLVAAALAELSLQHRLVVTMRDLRGYSYPEIARTLGVKEGTVKSALSRARANLLRRVRAAAPQGGSEASPRAFRALMSRRTCRRRTGQPCPETAR